MFSPNARLISLAIATAVSVGAGGLILALPSEDVSLESPAPRSSSPEAPKETPKEPLTAPSYTAPLPSLTPEKKPKTKPKPKAKPKPEKTLPVLPVEPSEPPKTGPSQMSSFTVNFPPDPRRTQNIARAVELINGSVIQPGQVWSFNGTVGERTKANGFTEGLIIRDGAYKAELGGGISALATTMYNAAFFAGIQAPEHGPHVFYIERYPEGREATVSWGYLDLKLRNDTDKPVTIRTSSTPEKVSVSLWGTREYDSVSAYKHPRTNVVEPRTEHSSNPACEPQPPGEGFKVKVDRIYRNDGREVKRNSVTTRYIPRNKVVCDPPASP